MANPPHKLRAVAHERAQWLADPNDPEEPSDVRPSGYDLEETIRSSPIDLVGGPFTMVQLPESAPIPDESLASFRDRTELTVVIASELVDRVEGAIATEGPFRLLRVRVSVPFLVEGFLAAIAEALASVHVNVLIWSTFSFDYAFVRADELTHALEVLTKRGFPEGDREEQSVRPPEGA